MLAPIEERIEKHGHAFRFEHAEVTVLQRAVHQYLVFLINRELDALPQKSLSRIVNKLPASEISQAFSELIEGPFAGDFPCFENAFSMAAYNKNMIRVVLYQRTKHKFVQGMQKEVQQWVQAAIRKPLLPISFRHVLDNLLIFNISL